MYVSVFQSCSHECKCQKRAFGFPGAGVTVVSSHATWIPGTEFRSSVRAWLTLNQEPSLQPNIFPFKSMHFSGLARWISRLRHLLANLRTWGWFLGFTSVEGELTLIRCNFHMLYAHTHKRAHIHNALLNFALLISVLREGSLRTMYLTQFQNQFPGTDRFIIKDFTTEAWESQHFHNIWAGVASAAPNAQDVGPEKLTS